MAGKKLTCFPFQTFFVSRETSNCPLISDIIRFGRELDRSGLLKDCRCSVSLGFGKRLVINSENIDFKVIKQEDIVEVVDYDPVRNIVLAIGKKDPCYETPVHWMVQNARNDVNAVFQINSGVIFEQLRDDLPVTRSELPYGSVELAKEILRTLREGKHILLKNVGMVMVGFSLKEITDSLSKMELLKHQRGFSSESRRERV